MDDRIFCNVMKETTVKEKYEQYLSAADKTKVVNNTTFYKAVDIEFLKLQGKDTISIVLPYIIFKDNAGSKLIMNEDGTIFKLKGPAFIRFIDEIPQWYFECGSFLIDEFDCSLEAVGEYFKSI